MCLDGILLNYAKLYETIGVFFSIKKVKEFTLNFAISSGIIEKLLMMVY